MSIVLEECLKGAASNLSNSVNLLDELLHKSVYVFLIELSLSPQVLAQLCKEFLVCKFLNKRCQCSHCLFTDPATDITSAIKSIVVQSLVEGVEDWLDESNLDILKANTEGNLAE